MAWIFDPAAVAIDVAVVLDPTRTVEVVVPIEGGTVSATGADGTMYTLDVPADALLTETAIGLTPVTSMAGLPFGGDPTYAVQMSPDGLFLYRPAILTITPTQPIPRSQQIVFGYQGEGRDLILAPPVLGSSEIKIHVLHFSGNGVTKGTLADIEPVRQRLGGDAERRLSNALAAEFIRIQQEGGDSEGAPEVNAFETVTKRYVEEVVRPRVAAAGTSCAAGRLAMETVLGLERQRQLNGSSETDLDVEDYSSLLTKAARLCVLEEFELCVKNHVIHRIATVYRQFARQFQILTLDESVLDEARELTVKCLTFKLKFESTGTLTAADGGYESRVTSEVVLRYDLDSNQISGQAPLVNEDFEFHTPCGATSIRGGGTFTVGNLRILTEGSSAVDQNVNFKLNYLPGATSESAIAKICGSTGAPFKLPPFPAWTSTFLAGHAAELDRNSDVGGGYVSLDWEVFGNAYFAKKEWIKEEGAIVEAGTFKLYHTPGG